MMPVISENTKAILLITAPLIVGRNSSSPDILTPGEYKRLACQLRELQREPADLLSPDAEELFLACSHIIDEIRLHRLLDRGFQLSQAIERWQTRSIRVISRADNAYPKRIKDRLREDAPAVFYVCGSLDFLESGGLAVVGSRHVDNSLIEYTMAIGRLAARAKRTIVSGGARGIDQAAMRGAIEAGGKVIGVLADSLEKTSMNREHRNLIKDSQLVIISPYDPSAGFNVGNAMQRNKLIYALADASLVVSSDLNKGGTWAGAKEQLDKLQLVPVYVRISEDPSPGLVALRKKGAIPWPNPQNVDAFMATLNISPPTVSKSIKVNGMLFSNDDHLPSIPPQPIMSNAQSAMHTANKESQSVVQEEEKSLPLTPKTMGKIETDSTLEHKEITPADKIFSVVRETLQQLLKSPKSAAEIATALDIKNVQAGVWLQRLVEESVLQKTKNPTRYVVTHPSLFQISHQEKSSGNK